MLRVSDRGWQPCGLGAGPWGTPVRFLIFPAYSHDSHLVPTIGVTRGALGADLDGQDVRLEGEASRFRWLRAPAPKISRSWGLWFSGRGGHRGELHGLLFAARILSWMVRPLNQPSRAGRAGVRRGGTQTGSVQTESPPRCYYTAGVRGPIPCSARASCVTGIAVCSGTKPEPRRLVHTLVNSAPNKRIWAE
jgi:hypothetical protein